MFAQSSSPTRAHRIGQALEPSQTSISTSRMPRFLISDGTRSQYLARLGAKAAHERLITLHTDGGLFRLNAQRLYEKVCDRFDNRGVKNLTPSANKEFLIGDVPAITLKESTREFALPRVSRSTRLTRSSYP